MAGGLRGLADCLPGGRAAAAGGCRYRTLAPPAPQFHWTWLLPVVAATAAWIVEARGMQLAAVLTIVIGATVGTVVMKSKAAPDLDAIASARTLHHQIADRQENVCLDSVPRGMEYSLEYYFVPPLPKCDQRPRPCGYINWRGSFRRSDRRNPLPSRDAEKTHFGPRMDTDSHG